MLLPTRHSPLTRINGDMTRNVNALSVPSTPPARPLGKRRTPATSDHNRDQHRSHREA